MDSDTERDSSAEYRRRRAAALVGVFGAVAVLGWACSPSGGEQRDQVPASPSAPKVPIAMPTVTVTATTEVTRTAGPAARDGVCDPESVVVTVRATRDAYGPGERPGFTVTAVNTGARECGFDVGGLDLRITSGSDRVWSSAACAKGGTREATLRRGVPHVRTVTWDRRRAGEGCEGALARPGTYVAALQDFRIPKRVFRLR